jgi:8-oxo-dGTP pyrophosphatase MutT (NUDIX family)
MTQLGDKHYTATVYILTDSQPRKALLLHHKKLDSWLPPGGHQDPDESAYQTAIREVMEETGLDITGYLPKPADIDQERTLLPLPKMMIQQVIPAHGSEPDHYHLDMEYMVYLPEQMVVRAEQEHHDIRWVTLDDLAGLSLFPDVADFLTKELSR